jgi:Mn2+/Fe2+ NRAMP family transporter
VAGHHSIDNAAQAAEALRPSAGNAAGIFFALGVVGVALLAVPVMTTGAAYDLSQALGWPQGLNKRPGEAKRFYAAITCFMLAAIAMNFFGINPMRALVWAGFVQGFSTPPLLLLILRMTNNRAIMNDRVNGRTLNVLGYITTAAIFAASFSLIVSWIL